MFTGLIQCVGQVTAIEDLGGDRRLRVACRELSLDELGASVAVNGVCLTAVEFENDHRVRFLGQTLDHIYVRGLSAVDAETRPVTTSDHNPMSATLAM